MIPPQLHNPDFKFILVKDKDKRPLENYWQCSTLKAAIDNWESEKSDANKKGDKFTKEKPSRLTQYRFDDQVLINHIKNGGNYGIICGAGGLIVADIDNITEDMEFPKTFTVDTVSGGKHLYILCHDIKKKIILETDGIHIGEIQAGGNTQVIGPGCRAKSKKDGEIKEYVVSDESPFIELSLEQLKDIFGKYFKNQDKANGKQAYQDSKYELDVEKVISLSGFKKKGSEYEGKHPVHGSTGGHNFSVNTQKNAWHCFRHGCGGGILELISLVEGITTCGSKLTSKEFNLVLEIASKKYGMTQKQPSTPQDLQIQVLQLIAGGSIDEATEMVVDDILKRYHIYTVRDDKAPEMWIYHDGIYTPHGKTYVQEECRNILGNAYTIFLANQIVNKIMADTYVDVLEFFQPKNGDWICVLNGQLNPITRELKDFNSSDIHFTKLPVTYDPNATCPNINHHFREITSDESDVKVLEEGSGWFLANEYKPEKAVMLSGMGRNGKGKTIMMWKEFLGVDNVATIALHQFEQDQYAAGDLLNKRANLAGDIDSEALKYTGLFKQITGRDPISTNRKYLSRIKFINNAKMICAANQLPTTLDMSEGFFSRWILIDFPYKFIPQNEYDLTPENDRKNLKVADLDIINKLTTPNELSGLLNLAIEGLHRLIKNGDFSTSMTTEQVKNNWIRKSDSFTAFTGEFLQEDYGSFISKQELRHVYGEYCRRNKLRIANDKHIKNVMSEVLGAFEARRSDIGDRNFVWDGVSWKNIPGQGGQGGQGFPTTSLTRKGTSSNTLATLATLATSSTDTITNNSREDFFKVLDYLEIHPYAKLLDLRELNILGLEQILQQLKIIGKIYEPHVGKFDLVNRKVEM